MKWRIYKEANEILHDTEEWDMFVVNIGWAGPEGYDDMEDWDEACRAWDKFIEDNDLPMCVGMKFPKGMDVDIKHVLEKQYGLHVEDFDIDRSEGAMEFQTPWLEWTPEGWQETDEVEFVSESNDVNLKKLLKQNGVTKFPARTEFKPDSVSWSKSGGYAGQKALNKMCIDLEHAGWKRGEWRTGGIPDGSAVSNSNTYLSPDGQIVMSFCEHFGVTAHENYYSFTFKLAGGAVNESDEEESFTRSDRPQIYRYYDDDETPLEDFVKHVRSAEHQIEDLFIQNSDYYENEDDPWKTFCDDLSEGESLEESLDMQYYMNQAAYDQLPDDIKRHTHLYTGTCEFDAVTWLREIFERLMPICKDQYNESSRFGFNVGDDVELISDVEPNRFSSRGDVPAGTVGEVVAVDKPMRGVIKVKIEDGTVVSVPERKLKFAGTDNEPWEKFKTPAKPKPSLREILDKHGPEEIYLEPPKPGYPKWTGD